MLCKIILDDMSLYWPAHERESKHVDEEVKDDVKSKDLPLKRDAKLTKSKSSS